MDTAWIYVVYLRFRATLNYSSSGHIYLHNFFFSTFSMKIFMVDEYQLYVEVVWTTGVSRKIRFQTVLSTQWFSILLTLLNFSSIFSPEDFSFRKKRTIQRVSIYQCTYLSRRSLFKKDFTIINVHAFFLMGWWQRIFFFSHGGQDNSCMVLQNPDKM